MREAHARNPQLRHAPAGRQKRCGHCGEVGHNRKTCPQLVAAQAEQMAEAGTDPQPKEPKGRGGRAKAASPEAAQAPPASRVIVIEEVDDDPQGVAATSLAGAAAASSGSSSSSSSAGAGASPAPAVLSSAADVQQAAAAAAGDDQLPAAAGAAASAAGAAPTDMAAAKAAAAAAPPPPPPPKQQQPLQRPPEPPAVVAGEPSLPYSDVLQNRWLAPGFSLSPEGGWLFQLPQSKEECVAQAAQVRVLGAAAASHSGGCDGGWTQAATAGPCFPLLLETCLTCRPFIPCALTGGAARLGRWGSAAGSGAAAATGAAHRGRRLARRHPPAVQVWQQCGRGMSGFSHHALFALDRLPHPSFEQCPTCTLPSFSPPLPGWPSPWSSRCCCG